MEIVVNIYAKMYRSNCLQIYWKSTVKGKLPVNFKQVIISKPRKEHFCTIEAMLCTLSCFYTSDIKDGTGIVLFLSALAHDSQ